MQSLENYLNDLRPIQKVTLSQYLDDRNMQAVVERRLQLSAQVCIDVANHIIAALGLEVPQKQSEVFPILAQANIIPRELAERMAGLVGFRNILVHEYLKIDNELVYRNLQENLGDFEAFAQVIMERFVSDAG